jgi:cobalt-zinc-cadmium efflux system protein
MGDAASIGASYLLERKSARQPDGRYTYGYARYSVLGGLITTVILLLGSGLVINHAVQRILAPAQIHYDGMIAFAIVGVCVNFGAAFLTREGDSLNQRAVNLHMLEDVLGWVVVLVGAVVMRFTGWTLIDPLMSIAVALFILVNALKNLKQVLDLFLEKSPVDYRELLEHLHHVDGVQEVHHLHLRSLDGQRHYATMHIVTEADPQAVKAAVREELAEHGIVHATLELERPGELCEATHCHLEPTAAHGHHHHHHHH